MPFGFGGRKRGPPVQATKSRQRLQEAFDFALDLSLAHELAREYDEADHWLAVACEVEAELATYPEPNQ